MREILSHFQYLSPPQLWECRGTPHALHERWGVGFFVCIDKLPIFKFMLHNQLQLPHCQPLSLLSVKTFEC